MNDFSGGDARQPLSTNKIQGVVNHGVYMIATGKWPPGSKLPAIREAEQTWSVNRLTVVKGYRQLEAMGLVDNRGRAGFFVAGSPNLDQRFKHRHSLDRLYDEFAEKIASELSLSPLATFRYLAQLAEIKQREREEAAFLECTRSQAEGHALEIFKRFNMPILPLTLDELDRRPERVPAHVRVILVSMFHWEEAAYLRNDQWQLVPVTIAVAPDVLDQFSTTPKRVVLLGSEEVHAGHIAEDAAHFLGDIPLDLEIPGNLENRLNDLVSKQESGLALLLSPKVWGRLPRATQQIDSVGLIRFQITGDAWNPIADSLGLPLGNLDQS